MLMLEILKAMAISERNIFYELGTFFELLFLEPTEETICMLK